MQHYIQQIYDEVYQLFPEDRGETGLEYVRRNWIFPHHIDVMLDLAEQLSPKYHADLETCQIAIILHDTGLAYKRTEASPNGHEERSLEYASKLLKKHTVSPKQLESILECINATQQENPADSNEAKVVRTVDAMSQFTTVHFWAKAAFSGDWDRYVTWFEKKVRENFEKICFDEERKTIQPIRDHILAAIDLYKEKGKT